ncbi:MAG: hypothetical protein KatS3mg123_1863 [Burkholderiales bacterium]|nr:MAG: hypothetical protein KatS3mg123_1863 [Burkholderiales bacterium]
MRSEDVRGRSYAPAGKTPQIRVTHRREGLSVMSTVTNRGKTRWNEMLNADFKAVVSSKAPARAKGDPKKATISHLRRLQKITQTGDALLPA